jgi:hypothetical protein
MGHLRTTETSVTKVSLTVADPDAVLALYEWYSSYRVGSRWESDLLLSTAIDTCGLMLTQAQQFLGELGVPHASRQSLFKTQRDIIAPVVDKLAAAELAAVVQETNAKPSAKVQIDEQHSRPQKSAVTLGAAPFVTATAINDDELIVAIAHEDATDNKGGAVKRVQRALFDKLKDLTAPLSDCVTDACSSAHTTMHEVFAGSIHANCYQSHDLWHFLKDFLSEISALVSTRTAKYARTFKYLQLRALYDEGKITVNKLKSWWYNLATKVAEMTELNDDEKVAYFEAKWRGAAEHYGLTGDDKAGFEEWAETKISSIPYFIHGLTTSQTESLHSLNNKYAIKGKIRSFLLYTMRKNIALLHWNDHKRARASRGPGTTDDPDDWDDAAAPVSVSFRRKIALSIIRSVKL